MIHLSNIKSSSPKRSFFISSVVTGILSLFHINYYPSCHSNLNEFLIVLSHLLHLKNRCRNFKGLPDSSLASTYLNLCAYAFAPQLQQLCTAVSSSSGCLVYLSSLSPFRVNYYHPHSIYLLTKVVVLFAL